MSSSEKMNTILSRPHQKQTFEINFNNPRIQEIQLAFTLTGLSRSDLFSPFFPLHRIICAKLIEFFISIKSVDDLISIAGWGRDNINPNLFNYAFSAAILARPDTKNVLLLCPPEIFPDKFIPAEAFHRLVEELSVVPEGSRRPVPIDLTKTATDKYDETRMEYFRHDLGVNVCYYFWHLTHPFEAVRKELIDIDRRGELWYYFHQQLVARYNAERYCNGLLSVAPLSNFDLPIEEGYFPKLCTQHLEHSWSARCDGTCLTDLHRPYEGLVINKTQFQRWIDRACNAIELGAVIDENGTKIPLNNDKGVDILGNLLQSSVLSPNRKFYGDICHTGHALIAYCHDPDNLALQSYGVMGEPATCARDILFYRWYSYLVRIVQLHKSQLPVYTPEQLGFEGVKITSIGVKNGKNEINQLNTSWGESDFNLKYGLDFQPEGDVYASIKHLQCESFEYDLDIQNGGAERNGTIRLFLSQKCNVRDRELTFEELRMLMIELDKFEVTLKPGNNHITRKSSESSVTLPTENIFEPDKVRQKIAANGQDNSLFCLSGWPEYLLIPKGTKEGARFLLFAMISKDEKVDDKPKTDKMGTYDKCSSASSYCGLPNRKYPDKRPMGFPFDRRAPIDCVSLRSFLLPNMNTADVTIKFSSK